LRGWPLPAGQRRFRCRRGVWQAASPDVGGHFGCPDVRPVVTARVTLRAVEAHEAALRLAMGSRFCEARRDQLFDEWLGQRAVDYGNLQ
jgi:hypothetical protein